MRMGWLIKVIVAVALQYISPTCGTPLWFPLERTFSSDESLAHLDTSKQLAENKKIELTPEDDAHLLRIERFLSELLRLPTNTNGLPLLYMDIPEDDDERDEEIEDINEENAKRDESDDPDLMQSHIKRSRYYRQYPWKRQNIQATYEAENRYLCQPNKEDVYRLLVAMHDARRGSRGRSINFCNRKRPANQIFSHVRFLG